MIDKLAITSGDIDSNALFSAFGGQKAINKFNQHYDQVEVVQGEEGEHLYTLCSEPTRPGANPYKLEINPAKLPYKYSELMEIFDKAFELNQAKIQRIDLAADYEISVKEAFETVRIKQKKNFKALSDYRCGMTGFYVGARFEVFAVYDKNYEQRTRAFRPTSFKKIKRPHSNVLTRFEQRLMYKMTPVQKLSELPFLLTYNPFVKLQALAIKQELESSYKGFKTEKTIHGLHNTYREMNRHNNFKRNYGRDFVETNLPDKLREVYSANMGQFFDGASGECH